MPLILHSPPVELTVEYPGCKVIDDRKDCGKQKVAHFASENGRRILSFAPLNLGADIKKPLQLIP